MHIHIHALFVIRRMRKERLRSTMTQSVFAVPDPKENIHEQACIRTRHRSGSEPEHGSVRSNLYHCLNPKGCSVRAATGAGHAASQTVADACYETRQEAPSCSALWLPEGQEGCKTRACE